MRPFRRLLLAAAALTFTVAARPFASTPGRLAVARLQYDGGGDWYANPSSIPNLLRAIAERTALPIERAEAKVRLTDSALFDFPFLHVTGHGDIKFSDVEIQRLREYLRRGELSVELFSRGFAWLDTGTKDSLLDACNFVAAIEKRQGLKIACLEEIAFVNNFINAQQLSDLAKQYTNEFREYLLRVASDE